MIVAPALVTLLLLGILAVALAKRAEREHRRDCPVCRAIVLRNDL